MKRCGLCKPTHFRRDYGNLGSVLVFTRQWDKAIEQLRYSIDLDPNYWFDYYFLGRAYEQRRRLPEALTDSGGASDYRSDVIRSLRPSILVARAAHRASGWLVSLERVLLHAKCWCSHWSGFIRHCPTKAKRNCSTG